MSETPSPTSPASSGQTWALKCAVGLDVRECGLTYEEAARYLDVIDAEGAEDVIRVLQQKGAKGTPKLPKAARERAHNNLFADAWAAGETAARDHSPTPMQVVQRLNPLDDASPVVHAYEPVADGVCGFAWVNVTPGNSSFARWLVKNGHARKSYRSGVDIWISGYRQSMELKAAHAAAMAAHFRENGITAYSNSRMD